MSVSDKIKNRGAHGDSSFMLGGVPSSSENPPDLSVGFAKFEAGKQMPEMRFNVVPRFWRVEWGLKGNFEPDTINYTIEAECWNKAYSKALQEKPKIMSMLGLSEDDVFIRSVTRIPTEEDRV